MSPKPLIKSDGEVRELTKTDFKKAKPAKDVIPGLVEMQKKARGRPKSDVTKESITLRLDPDIIQHFKRKGRGWQTRLNKVLSEHIKTR